MSGLLDLEVTVPADEWAYTKRRLVYLETMLIRIVRDERRVQEWFSSVEIAAMRLPGLPASPNGIRTRASADNWRRRKARFGGHWQHVFHVTSLPARAFDTMIARIADLPPIDAVIPLDELMPKPPAPPPKLADDTNTAPPWVLPLMRIMRRETNGDLAAAWEMLPERLPPTIALPSIDEAAHILVVLGLAGNGPN
jgi:hypothetical protein